MTEIITNHPKIEAGESPDRQSYDPRSFSVLNQVDDEHFWFTTRNRLIINLAKKALGPGAGFRLLELGCGNANVLRFLHSAFPGSSVIGMDLFEEGLQFAWLRTKAPLLVADAYRAPFAANFDLVGMFDVLEHLEDDCVAARKAAAN